MLFAAAFGHMKPRKERKHKKRWLLWLGLVLLGFILYSNIRIDRYSKDKLYDTVSDVPHYHTALVLGTSPVGRFGGPNLFFLARIDAAAELYQAGKIDRILVSGDNRMPDSGPLIPWSGPKRFSVNPSSSSSARNFITNGLFSSPRRKESGRLVSMLPMSALPTASSHTSENGVPDARYSSTCCLERNPISWANPLTSDRPCYL